MSNQKAMIEVIRAMSGQANVLTIPRPYIDFMGSLDGGLFLSQLIYWSDRGADGWFYKTYAEWEEELTLSKYEVSKQVKILKEKRILETKIKKANGSPTVYYRFSFDEFQKSFVKFLHYRKSSNFTIESQVTSLSLTESTTKTTTETHDGADFSPEIESGFQEQVSQSAAEQLDREMTEQKSAPTDEPLSQYDRIFGDNPRQGVIDADNSKPRPTGDELLIEVLAGKVEQGVKFWIERMNYEKWVFESEAVEVAVAQFLHATGGFFTIPASAKRRKLWVKGVKEHLQEDLFNGVLGHLYESVWEDIEEKVRDNKLTVSHPLAFTHYLYAALHQEAQTGPALETAADGSVSI